MPFLFQPTLIFRELDEEDLERDGPKKVDGDSRPGGEEGPEPECAVAMFVTTLKEPNRPPSRGPQTAEYAATPRVSQLRRPSLGRIDATVPVGHRATRRQVRINAGRFCA